MNEETDWLYKHEPDYLFAVVRNHSEFDWRKERLAACGCFRQIWDLINDPDIRELVERVEDFADGLTNRLVFVQPRVPPEGFVSRIAIVARSLSSDNVQANSIAWQVRAAVDVEYLPNITFNVGFNKQVHLPQANLIRDIVMNPFRPVAFEDAWQTSTTIAIAQQMYNTRDFAAMPILADALEDAGSENADILDHCRNPDGIHVRGCWVVDLLLGKK